MKKILTFITAGIMMSALCTAVNAEVYYNAGEDMGIAATTAKPAGSSGAENTGDGIKLWFDAENAKGNVKANTEVFAFSEPDGLLQARIKFKLSSANTGIQRRITLYQDGTLNFCELVRIEGSKLSLYKSEISGVSLEGDKEYTIDLAIDTKTKDAWAHLDGVKLYEDNLGTKWKNFNYEELTFELQNTSTVNVTAEEEFLISEFSVTGAPGNITSSPENGAAFLNASDLEGITLNIGGHIKDGSYDGITLTADGEGREYKLDKKGDALLITPVPAFDDGVRYVLTVPKITDFSDRVCAENLEVSFFTAPDGYVYPELKLSGDETVYEGQRAAVKAEVLGNEIERVEFYVNGALYKTVKGNLGTYVIELLKEAGEYTVGARAFDSLGVNSVLKEMNVTVIKNSPTTINIALEDGKNYKKEELSAIEIGAEDEDGIERIEVFVDSKLEKTVEGASHTADFSYLSDGRHMLLVKAYDTIGMVSEKSISFIAEGALVESIAFSENFSDYESDGGIIPAGMTGAGSGGDEKYTSVELDDEHGKVLRFSTEGVKVNGKTSSGSWLKIPTGGTANYFEAEMDFFFEKKASAFVFMLKNTTSSDLTQDISFGSDEILIRTTAGNKSFFYEEGKWFTFKVCTDLENKVWSIYMDGEVLVENTPLTSKSIVMGDLRFIMQTGEGVPASVLIDNVTVKYFEKRMSVVNIAGDVASEGNKISPDSNKIDVYLSSSIDENSVTPDNIEIEGVKLSKVAYDSNARKISLYPDVQLESEKNYKIVLKKSILLMSGEALGTDIESVITTGTRKLDAINVTKKTVGSNAYISCSFVNSGAEAEVYAITSVYDGVKLKSTSVEKVTVKTGTTSFTGKALLNEGDRVTFSVLTSLKKPVSVLNKIYEF